MPETKDIIAPQERPAVETTPSVDGSHAVEISSLDQNESTAESVAVPAIVVPTVPTQPSPQAMADELVEEIEDILEDDLDAVYAGMPVAAQTTFKQEGEKTAVEIRGIVGKAHYTARAIFRRIATWLKLIPGVNKFFLEQEAKIKTDEIVELVEEKEHPNQTLQG